MFGILVEVAPLASIAGALDLIIPVTIPLPLIEVIDGGVHGLGVVEPDHLVSI